MDSLVDIVLDRDNECNILSLEEKLRELDNELYHLYDLRSSNTNRYNIALHRLIIRDVQDELTRCTGEVFPEENSQANCIALQQNLIDTLITLYREGSDREFLKRQIITYSKRLHNFMGRYFGRDDDYFRATLEEYGIAIDSPKYSPQRISSRYTSPYRSPKVHP